MTHSDDLIEKGYAVGLEIHNVGKRILEEMDAQLNLNAPAVDQGTDYIIPGDHLQNLITIIVNLKLPASLLQAEAEALARLSPLDDYMDELSPP